MIKLTVEIWKILKNEQESDCDARTTGSGARTLSS